MINKWRSRRQGLYRKRRYTVDFTVIQSKANLQPKTFGVHTTDELRVLDLLIPVLCGSLTGLALGLTGGGGSIFAVPLLTFVVGLPVTQSTALSLIAVGITAGVGATRGLIRKLAIVKVAIPMMIMGMLISPIGVFSSQFIDEPVRLLLFAALMVFIAAKMLLSQTTEPRAAVFNNDHRLGVGQKYTLLKQMLYLTRHPYFALGIGGMTTGFLSGFFGVGGGFLIVPTLLYATKLSMREVVSTSMLIITGVSLVAFVSFMFTPVTLPFDIGFKFVLGNMFGLYCGIKLAHRLSNTTLQRIFAIGIALVGIYTGLRGIL